MDSMSPASSPPAINSTAPPPSNFSTPAAPPTPSHPAPPPPPLSPSVITHSPPSHVTPSPPSHSRNSTASSSGSSVITTGVIAGIVIAGVTVLLLVCLLCVCCNRRKRRRTRDDYDDGGEVYYVPNPLPHLSPLQDGHNYNVQVQHWQQNYSPPAEYYQEPKSSSLPQLLPPRTPSSQLPSYSIPYMSRGVGSGSSIGSENRLTSTPSPEIPLGFSKSTFLYDELAMSTKNFSEANMLGKNDYGCVHKGILPNGKEIVIKSLKSSNGKGEQELQAEIEIIGRVHHRHLVPLLGYCITESHWLLVYEFVSNRTMEFHLHEKGMPSIDWPSRLRIAKGSAKGLAYLHEDCHPKIIHGDIKAGNILLNHKFEAKVADFGRAKIFSDGNTHVSTRVIGTLGYLAPEYVASGKLSDKSDVFSFGVVLLELITGWRPAEIARTSKSGSFVDFARPLIIEFLEENNFDAVVDPGLQNKYDRNEMARMIVCAAACVRQSAQRRPRMSQVIRALEGQLSLCDNNEASTPEHSPRYSSHESSEYDNGQYKEKKTFRRVGGAAGQEHVSSEYGGTVSEYDGTTSEYGVYQSGLSSELQSREMTREMEEMGKRKVDSQGFSGSSGL